MDDVWWSLLEPEAVLSAKRDPKWLLDRKIEWLLLMFCRDMKPHNMLMELDDQQVLMDFGSMVPAQYNQHEALALQDKAGERCSMPYRVPELFNVENNATIDERVDILWGALCTPCVSMRHHAWTVWHWPCRLGTSTSPTTAGTRASFMTWSWTCWWWTSWSDRTSTGCRSEQRIY